MSFLKGFKKTASIKNVFTEHPVGSRAAIGALLGGLTVGSTRHALGDKDEKNKKLKSLIAGLGGAYLGGAMGTLRGLSHLEKIKKPLKTILPAGSKHKKALLQEALERELAHISAAGKKKNRVWN